MQHMKITDNLGEFQKSLDSDKRYLNLSGRITELSDNIRALIFDDSPIEKSGKKIEGVSKMHDHVTGRFLFGYKLLVCGCNALYT